MFRHRKSLENAAIDHQNINNFFRKGSLIQFAAADAYIHQASGTKMIKVLLTPFIIYSKH